MIEAYNLSRAINRSLTGYDRKVRPNAGGPPVIVKIEFKVISFGEIKEANMVRHLRVPFGKNQTNFKFRGKGQKFDFAQILMVDSLGYNTTG